MSALRNRQLWILILCQALYQTANPIVITTSALASLPIAPSPFWVTLPVALMFFGILSATMPVSFLMKRHGRVTGFRLGAILTMLGGGLCAYALYIGSFWLFCLGLYIYGMASACGQYYRFAAAEVTLKHYRARAISYVMAGGIIAAFAGPTLANLSVNWVTTTVYMGCYIVIVLIGLVNFLALFMASVPMPTAEERAIGSRPLSVIIRQPLFITAVTAAALGYAIMTLVMNATPLAMDMFGHSFGSTALVIQWHVVAMFAPSFFTGNLIERYGVMNILTTGAVLTLACVVLNLTGTSLVHFWTALVLLGLGWNFLFVGGTSLLTHTYRVEEKAFAQSINDFGIFGIVGASALLSGMLHSWIGWQGVNIAVIPFLIFVLFIIATQGRPYQDKLDPEAG